MTTRCSARATSRERLLRSSASEPDTPLRSTFVESQTMASTPSSPTRLSASESVTGPTSGSGSIFQSPVWRTVPSGVRMASAFGSGIEWVSVIISNSNGPRAKRPERGTTVIAAALARPASSSLRLRMEAVNGVA